MNIWNKVLIGLICFLAVLAAFWSAKTLNHHVHRGAEIKKMKDETDGALKLIETYKDYDKGIPTLEVRNAALLANRTENWRFCTPGSVESLPNKRARIVFSTGREPAATMSAGDTIYVFDQRPFGTGGKYLGRFAVIQVQGADVAAESLDVLTDLELQNLVSSQREIAQAAQFVPNELEDSTQEAQGQAAWSVFSRCPADRPDLFKDLSDEDKEKYLPELIREAYSQAPEDFRAIDFGTLFTSYYQKRVENAAALAEKLMQKNGIDESNRLASEALAFCRDENERIEKEIEQMEAQRKEVEERCKELDAMCARMASDVQQIQKNNERMVEEIRKIQMETLQKSGRTASEPISTTSR